MAVQYIVKSAQDDPFCLTLFFITIFGSITHVISGYNAVSELQDPNYDQEAHEYVNHLHPYRRLLHIVLPHAEKNILCILCRAQIFRRRRRR